MTAWILRFVRNVRSPSRLRCTGDIKASEYDNAEKLLFKFAQQESFQGINDPCLIGLNAKLDENGLIRKKTLISNQIDEFGFRYPVILRHDHKLTRLLIENVHKASHHAGCNTVLSLIREKVWILSSRRAVRSVLNKCVTCRRYTAKSLETEPASLPLNRVRDASVFEVTGID